MLIAITKPLCFNAIMMSYRVQVVIIVMGFFSTMALAKEASPLPHNLAEAQDFTIKVLRQLVQVDTSNPPGNETKAAKILEHYLTRAGIQAQIYESARGRGNLVARLKGDGTEQPILLVSHLDVVGVEKDHWTKRPFGADIINGRLYGRGSSDVKDLAAIDLAVMLLLKSSGVHLHRDVIMASVADEESGGEFGMQFLITKHWPEIKAEYAFNEGSRGRPYMKDGHVTWASLQVTERRSVDVKLTAHGTSAHSMLQMPDNALYTLARALDKLSQYHPPLELNEATNAYVEGMAAFTHKSKKDLMPETPGDTEESRGLYGMFHDTINPTMMKAGFRDNVIPATAEAIVNCRVLPHRNVDELLKKFVDVIGDSRVTVALDEPAPPQVPISRIDSEAVLAYTHVIHTLYGSQVPFIPTVGAGATDSRFLRAKGVNAYALEPADEGVQNGHGNDESVSIDGVRAAVEIYRDVITELAAHGAKAKGL